MKEYKVIVLEVAKVDIREARLWYNSQQKGLGLRLQADMKSTILLVASNPTSFAIRYFDLRLANFDVFPYAIHFYIDDLNDTVYITGIVHTSRHPDFPKKDNKMATVKTAAILIRRNNFKLQLLHLPSSS